jgi:predicted site-specific integrase-resolvase
MPPKRRELGDPDDIWWTIDQAAEHLGYKRATIERYIREGLPRYFRKYVKRDELLAEHRRRAQREIATRLRPQSQASTPP